MSINLEREREMADPPKTILVIGGGLGGLAFAQIVRHSEVGHKYKVTIYERDASATQRGQGYQISINRAGLACLSSIPHIATVLDTRPRDKVNAAIMLDHKLNIMFEFRQMPWSDGIAGLVNRWKLRQALSEGLDVKWGKKFVRYEETESEVIAYFEDGTHAVGDLLIGADGSKSKVRAQRCPDLQLEQLPILSTGGSVALTPAVKSKLPWLVQLTDNAYIARVLAPNGTSVLVMNYAAQVENGEPRLIWIILFPSAMVPNFPTDPAEVKTEVDSMANKILCKELATLISETRIENYLFPAPRLQAIVPVNGNPLATTSRVTLLGDAAHAMTPQRGLGANTAFADAADLAHVLVQQDGNDPLLGLAHYQEVMIKRGFNAVKMSRQMTTTLHLTGMQSVVRNVLFRAIGWILWGKRIVWG
jgi:2-polyprenyl-6-methoxyphenol hydroxylase-like FAD-dependent oxidoreductase